MELEEIEEEAEAFAEIEAELEEVEAEMEEVLTELRDLPQKAARETKFADFVGAEAVSPERVEQLEQRKEELAERREDLRAEVDEAREELMADFTSEELVVPLTMEPEKKDREWVFGFRDGQRFPHAISFLGETVGLGHPIRVEGVLISEKGVRVPIEEFEVDESEAMEAVMDAFDQLQTTLELKLPDEEPRW